MSSALELRPEIRPEGLDSLYSRVEVTDLTFFGALHLVPIYESDAATAASTSFKFELSGGEASTTTTGRPLWLERPGRYTVLMTIHPMGGDYSVDRTAVLERKRAVGGKDSCRGEAAPVTADDAGEAAPTTRTMRNGSCADNSERNNEAAPTTANEDDQRKPRPSRLTRPRWKLRPPPPMMPSWRRHLRR